MFWHIYERREKLFVLLSANENTNFHFIYWTRIFTNVYYFVIDIQFLLKAVHLWLYLDWFFSINFLSIFVVDVLNLLVRQQLFMQIKLHIFRFSSSASVHEIPLSAGDLFSCTFYYKVVCRMLECTVSCVCLIACYQLFFWPIYTYIFIYIYV